MILWGYVGGRRSRRKAPAQIRRSFAILFNRARARARYRSRSLIVVSEKEGEKRERERARARLENRNTTLPPSDNDQVRSLQLLDQFIVERPTKQPKSFFAGTSNHDVGNAVLLGKRN